MTITKRFLALLTAVVMTALFLASCAEEEPYDPFAGLEFSDVTTSPTVTEKSPEVDSDLPDEFPYNLEWGGDAARSSPYYKEYYAMTRKEQEVFEDGLKRGYMEELGLLADYEANIHVYNFDDGTTTVFTPGGFGTSFSGDYYKYTFSYDDPTYIVYVVDTNVPGPCSVEFSFTEKDPVTGEEKPIVQTFDNEDGECGIKCIARPDDGFYINGYNISVTFLGKFGGGSGRNAPSDEQFITEVQRAVNRMSEIDGIPYVNIRYEKMKYENPDKTVIVWLCDGMLSYISENAQIAVNEYLSTLGRDYLVCFATMTADFDDPDGNDYYDLIKQRMGQGCPFDIISTGATFVHSRNLASAYHRYVLDGIYEPLGELLRDTELGQKYLGIVPEGYLKTFDVNGEVYGVAGGDSAIARGIGYQVNKKLAEKYGWDINKPVTDQLDILKTVSENEAGCATVVADAPYCGLNFYPNSIANIPAVYYDAETDSIKRITEDEEWQELPRLMSALAAAGFENEYKAVSTNRTKNTFFLWLYCDPVPYEWGETTYMTLYGEATEVITAYSPTGIRCAEQSAGVSASSEHKDEAFDFLMLSQTDAYLNNLLNFGVEGEDYELTDGVVKSAFGIKTFANSFICYPRNREPADFAERLTNLFETAEVPATIGFAFDAESVAEEFNRLRAIINNCDLFTADFDEGIAGLNKELDDAGIDKVLEEINKQYKEWKGNKK